MRMSDMTWLISLITTHSSYFLLQTNFIIKLMHGLTPARDAWACTHQIMIHPIIPHFLCDLDWVDINILVVKLIGLNPEIMGGQSLLRLNMENIYSDTQGIEEWKIFGG